MIKEQSKKIINYPVNVYWCQITINGREFTKLEISQYYQTKSGRSNISDEIIKELIYQLYDKEIEKTSLYYNSEPLYIGHRAYNLVWDYDEKITNNTLLIINCYRERKFDLK